MSRPLIPCPESVVPLLGALPDPMIADQARVSTATVRRWRDEREISPCRDGGPPRTVMTATTTRKRLDALRERLGGLSWAHLAARCGVSRQAIHAARRDGVTPATLRTWERQAAASHQLAHAGPLVYHQPEGVAALLGKVTDTEIGERYGVPRQVVARWRAAAGIKAAPKSGRPVTTPLPVDVVRARLEALRAQHGGGTWAEVAAHLGLRRQSLTSARVRGVTAATLERWEALPVRATDSATSEILSSVGLTP